MAMLADLVLQTSNAPGTGTCNLNAPPPTDRVSFISQFPTTSLVYYVLDDNAQSEWGVGTFVPGAPDTLQRTTVLGNTSNTTSRLNFTGLTKVYNALPSSRTVYVDNSNTVVVPAGGRFAPLSGGVPIGAGMQYFGSSAPAGWLFCGGQWVSRSTYSALFSVIGVTYGAGDGSSTFALPDLRGRVPAGVDNMGGTLAGRLAGVCASTTLGTGYGDQWLHSHTHTLALNDSLHTHGITEPPGGHYHTVNDPQHQHGLGGLVMNFIDPSAFGFPNISTGGAGKGWLATGGASNFAPTNIGINQNTTGISINGGATGNTTGVANAAGAGGSQNVQPTLICNYIICSGV